MLINIESSDGTKALNFNIPRNYCLKINRYEEIAINIESDVDYQSIKIYTYYIKTKEDIENIFIKLENIFQIKLCDKFKKVLAERLQKNKSFAFFKGDLLSIMQYYNV